MSDMTLDDAIRICREISYDLLDTDNRSMHALDMVKAAASRAQEYERKLGVGPEEIVAAGQMVMTEHDVLGAYFMLQDIAGRFVVPCRIAVLEDPASHEATQDRKEDKP